MSMGYRGKATNAPRENVAVQAQAERDSAWGELTGKVVSFDPQKQTATIQPDYRPVHNGEHVDMPELQEVPVRFPRAGGFIITKPVKAGDKVTLRPQMRSSEEFHTGGKYEAVKDRRTMSLSDMEAFLEGGEPLTNPIPEFNTNNLEIRTESGEFKIEMSADGKFRIKGSQGDVYDLLTQVVEFLGEEPALIHQADYAAIGVKLRGMSLA